MSSMMKLLFLVLCVFTGGVYSAARGLASNSTTLCANGCNWSNSDIWDGGVVPTSSDSVDINVQGTYTVYVDVDVSVTDFDIGSNTYSDGKITFIVLSGVTFISTGGANAGLTTTIKVANNASFLITGNGLTYGSLIVNGTASFGGSNPSLQINTYDTQASIHQVEGYLELNDATIVATQGVDITGASTFKGSGNINGTLSARGTIYVGVSGIANLNIYGDLQLTTSTVFTPTIYIDVESLTSFDHIYISGNCLQDGDLLVNLLNDFEPLSHSSYIAFNYSSQRNGFSTIRGTSLLERFSSNWQAVVDQSYTALLFDDATTVLISFTTILGCLLFSLL